MTGTVTVGGMLTVKSGVKLAVRLTGPLTTSDCGAAALATPPVRPVNAQPEFTVAPTVTEVPAAYHPPGGVNVTFPAADGLV